MERSRTAGRASPRVLEDPIDPRLPPGSRLPGAVQSLQWFRDPVRFMESNRSRHGPDFTVKLGPLRRCAFISDPELAWEVLTGRPELMEMGSTNGIFRPVLGDRSLFLLDGENHRFHRGQMAPAFHRRAIRRFADLVGELTAREIGSWEEGKPFPLQERMREVTLEMILRAVIGLVNPAYEQRLRVLIHELLDLVQNPIAVLPAFQRELGGRTPFARLMAVVGEIEKLLYAEITERRHDPTREQRDDVLSMLVRPRSHEDGFLGDREIRDELLTLLIAGHETTATTISWAFERLLRNPRVHDRLVDELDLGLEDGYLDAVVRETLRQRPVLPITARKLTKPVELGEYRFPARWILMPCIYLIHNDPDVFPDPELFKPERFLEPDPPSNRVWIPFGAGPRHCIGSGLAMLAVKVILKTIVRSLELQPDRPEPEQVTRRNFTLGPGRGARVVVVRRRDQPVRHSAELAPA